ncbi:glutathione S-transferase [Echria macrotheca]|uniref:Glutathione S-transferase n=1 Tax=Echria macrotheca TaxID=438768 RepID=A0AAJ0BI18_9PEZI|nr:glutathione S-transferase [Echria macrotheca]
MATVDTTVQPSPSGAAAAFAAKHAAPHPLKLYGGWFCPFVQRVWIVLAEKKIPHQYVEINPYHKAADFLRLNPRGLVPTLAIHPSPDSDSEEVRVLYESAVVVEYLDEAFCDQSLYGRDLLPRDKGSEYERARCRLWMDFVSSRVVPGFYRFIQHSEESGESLEEVREKFLDGLRSFVEEMRPAEEGPWFLGGRFSLVDVMLAPWAMRLFLLDWYKKPGGLGIREARERGGEEEKKIWERWDVWFDAVTNRQSVRDTWSDEEDYVKAYRRYAENTTQSEVAKATRAGRSLP